MPHRVSQGFDFTTHMRRMCDDIVRRSTQMSHIVIDRVAIAFAQTRKPVQHGMWASLTPMRFQGGALEQTRQGKRYTVQRLYDRGGSEMLYILTFYMPRFMDLSFQDKLTTIFHELWHISPAFDGDLRRHPGRCYAHTGSQANYDAHMAKLANHWLKLEPDPSLYVFLHLNFVQLQQDHGQVFGTRIPRPRLLPVTAS